MGHRVMGVDVSRAKVEMLESGRSPIVEARMNEMVAEYHKSCRLHATTDPAEAVLDSEVSFICVGTPSLRNGKLDLSHIENVAHEIGAALRQKSAHHVVVLRSTVLPGTTSNIATSSTSGSAGKTTPKPSETELNSFHSAAAGPLTTSAARTKAIKRIFGLLSAKMVQTP